jgi:hypothetical protein
VPPEQGLRGDEERRPSLAGEDPARRREEHPVETTKGRSAHLPAEDLELVAQDGVLELEGSEARRPAEQSEESEQHKVEYEQHGGRWYEEAGEVPNPSFGAL